jgi:hypothetical protein
VFWGAGTAKICQRYTFLKKRIRTSKDVRIRVFGVFAGTCYCIGTYRYVLVPVPNRCGPVARYRESHKHNTDQTTVEYHINYTLIYDFEHPL